MAAELANSNSLFRDRLLDMSGEPCQKPLLVILEASPV